MKIITHAGKSHPDELLAIALISIKEDVSIDDIEIERLNDLLPFEHPPADFVVDIGGEYDPSLGKFDHHHFSKDHPAECALTLVAKHYGIDLADFPFMQKIAILDSKGPYYWFEQKFGRRPKTDKEVNEALNNRESAFWYFTRVADQDFKTGLKQAKSWLLMELHSQATQKEASRRCANIIDLGSFKMLFFNKKDARGTGAVCDEMVEADPSIIVTGLLDDRGDGYSAMRLADNKRVDFTPRSGEPGCVFAHSNGFCLKWEKNWEGFVDAVRRSVTD